MALKPCNAHARSASHALGFCPPSIWAVWRGFNTDSVLRKLFSGEKDLAKPWLISRPHSFPRPLLFARRLEPSSGFFGRRNQLKNYFFYLFCKIFNTSSTRFLFVASSVLSLDFQSFPSKFTATPPASLTSKTPGAKL